MMRSKPSRWNPAALLCLLAITAIACHDRGTSPTVPPLGATVHSGGATFRVWVPFVDSVSVKINDQPPVRAEKRGGKRRQYHLVRRHRRCESGRPLSVPHRGQWRHPCVHRPSCPTTDQP